MSAKSHGDQWQHKPVQQLVMRTTWPDRVMAVVAWLLALLVLGGFGWMLIDLSMRALSQLHWDSLWTMPSNFGRSGGIAPMLVATMWTTLIALAVAAPVALLTAIALVDAERARRPWARLASILLDVVAAAPSVVVGLCGMLVFGQWCGLGYSMLTGGLTLASMVLPVVVRLTADALRSVDSLQRQAALAVGASRWGRLRMVELPSAWRGIMTGLLLGMARALSETAALLFTAGYAMQLALTPLDGGRTLSVHIFDMALNVPGGQASAAAAAVLLLLVVAVVAVAVNLWSHWWQRHRGWI